MILLKIGQSFFSQGSNKPGSVGNGFVQLPKC